jgi:hypothetical protein
MHIIHDKAAKHFIILQLVRKKAFLTEKNMML